MDRFPLPLSANYAYHDAWNPVPGGHAGTDIFAAAGTPVLAVTSGIAKRGENAKGGKTVYLRDASGTAQYYYAHLRNWAPLLRGAAHWVRVQAGEPLGTVGSSGNAAGKDPHLHFAIRRHNNLTDPFPSLVRVDPKRGLSVQQAVGQVILLYIAWQLVKNWRT